VKDKTGRPVYVPVWQRSYHDLERRAPLYPPATISYIYSGQFRVSSKSASFTLSGEMVVLVDASACDIVLTLPSAADYLHKVYTIKKVDSSGHSITIEGDVNTETIDGEKSISFNLQYQYVTIICDSLDWHIIGGEYVKMEDILVEVKSELELMNREMRETNLHLKSLSGEEIAEEDKE